MTSRRWIIGLALLVVLTLTGLGVLWQVKAQQQGSGADRYRFAAFTDTPLEKPLYLVEAPDDSDRLFVVTQPGQIFIVAPDGAVQSPAFLDMRDRVDDSAFERGLLGLAFHPEFADNDLFYVYYTRAGGDVVIARYTVDAANPDQADPDSEAVLLVIEQPYANHNGGMIEFGPDGYLYLGVGDGGSGGDPQENGQNPTTLLGTILRLDVDNVPEGAMYGIPPDNPFVDNDTGRPEVWAYGLRNPWRFSFDQQTDDLYIADVGQNEIEEINFEAADSPGGLNYGWARYEGTAPFKGSQVADTVFPVTEYTHADGCSVTGGYVYRGETLPELDGVYFYGDFCSGRVWALQRTEDGDWQNELFLNTDFTITSFGQDQAGELYLADQASGLIYQLVAIEDDEATSAD